MGVMAITARSSKMDDGIVVRSPNPSIIGRRVGEASVARLGPLYDELVFGRDFLTIKPSPNYDGF